MTLNDKSAGLGIRLPNPPRPAGNYQPVTIRNGLGFVSGQVPVRDGRLLFTGRVGIELTPAQGKAAAELAALNVLAQIDRALPSWDQFGGLLRVEGYVASANGFTSQPEILDGASDLFVDVLGDLGSHARAAVSVQQLPLDAPVELVVTFAVNPARMVSS